MLWFEEEARSEAMFSDLELYNLPRPAHALEGHIPFPCLPSSCPHPASPHTTMGRPGAAPTTAGVKDRKKPHISTLVERIKIFTFRSHSLCYLHEARHCDTLCLWGKNSDLSWEKLPQGTLQPEGQLQSNFYSREHVCPVSPIQAVALGMALTLGRVGWKS